MEVKLPHLQSQISPLTGRDGKGATGIGKQRCKMVAGLETDGIRYIIKKNKAKENKNDER